MKKLSLLIVIIAFSLAFGSLAHANKIIKVKGISALDGDTFTILEGKSKKKVSLFGVDAPEKGQDYYAQAKKFTDKMIKGKKLTIEYQKKGPKGEIIGIVKVGDKNLGRELVVKGMAWYNKKQDPKNKKMAELMAAAKKAKRGLWKGPMAPWDYRAKIFKK